MPLCGPKRLPAFGIWTANMEKTHHLAQQAQHGPATWPSRKLYRMGLVLAGPAYLSLLYRESVYEHIYASYKSNCPKMVGLLGLLGLSNKINDLWRGRQGDLLGQDGLLGQDPLLARLAPGTIPPSAIVSPS